MAIETICEHLDCTACRACAQLCPKGAISFKPDSEGFFYPSVGKACIECGLCSARCPANNTTPTSRAIFHMGWHRDEEVLKRSSSGGIFTALAQYVFDRGGVVFGVEWREDGWLGHVPIELEADLDRIRLSKYYQADVGESYKLVRHHLASGRLVLFSGTACQIAGLLAYLGAGVPLEGLITVDILCHGVASRKVVDAFVASKERQFGKRVASYAFRVKEEGRGWYNGGSTRVELRFADGSSTIESGRYDTFFLGFNNNFFLRESCYRCRYCGTNRVSDMTLADYWRCEHEEITERELLLGVSLVLANSKRGEDILEGLTDSLVLYEIDGTKAIANNRALARPQDRPAIRDRFFADMRRHGYDTVVKSQFRTLFLKRRMKSALRVVLPTFLYNLLFDR